ncbi:MAG TPA: tripartite tricarboxylate transporter substrate-binding protein [Rhodocyclaceae bacterium]|nr:tripartite tricarboxylate transporter substrate-binding protein [Rhodocyclaceae bacterium]
MNTIARFAALLSVLAGHGAAWAAWEPDKPVELIVPSGAETRIDQTARLIQGIVVKHKLMKQDLVIANKSGGMGAEAFFLLKNGLVEPHRIMIAGNGLFSVPLTTGVPFNWKNFSPVVTLSLEPFILWTHSKDGYESARAYLDAAKSAGPYKMKMRGAGTKQEDQFLTIAIERATGVKFTYLPSKPFPDEGSQQAFDSALFNPMERETLSRNGTLTPQCVFNDTRLSVGRKSNGTLAWDEIPTCKEAGIDVSYQAPTSIFMGPGVTDEQKKYFITLFKQVVETPEWGGYMEQGAYSRVFMTGQELRSWLAATEEMHKRAVTPICEYKYPCY